MGIGDWGLGIGDWGLANPQSPIPIKKYKIYFQLNKLLLKLQNIIIKYIY